MTDIAHLGIEVTTTRVRDAIRDLDQLVVAGKRADEQLTKIGKGASGTGTRTATGRLADEMNAAATATSKLDRATGGAISSLRRQSEIERSLTSETGQRLRIQRQLTDNTELAARLTHRAAQAHAEFRRAVADASTTTSDLVAAKGRLARATLATNNQLITAGGLLTRMQQHTNSVTSAIGQLGQQAQGSLSTMHAWMGRVVAAAAAMGVAIGAKSIVDAADAWAMMTARVRVFSESADAAKTAIQGIYRAAQTTSSGVEDVAKLFTRLAMNSTELGVSQQQLLQLVTSVGQALKISGANTSEASSAMLQFAQAMGSGKLAGDEFRSLMENGPRLAKALADGLQVPIGALKDMAKEGKLTSEVVVAAILSQHEVLEREFAQLPNTVSAAMVRVQNAWLAMIGKLNEQTEFTAPIVERLNRLTQLLENPATLAAAAQLASTIVSGMTMAGQALATLAQHLDVVVGFVTALAAAKLIAGVTSMASAIAASGGALAAIAAFAAANPIGIIVAAVVAAGGAFFLFRDQVADAMAAIKSALLTFGDTLRSWDAAILAARNDALAALARLYDDMVSAIKSAGSRIFESITQPFRDAFDWIRRQWERLPFTRPGTLEGIEGGGGDVQLRGSGGDDIPSISPQAAARLVLTARTATERATDEMQRIWSRTGDRLVDMGADSFDRITATGRLSFQELANDALSIMRRAFAQIAAEAIIRPLVTPPIQVSDATRATIDPDAVLRALSGEPVQIEAAA